MINDALKFSKLEWRLEQADSSCVVAYQLPEGAAASQKLKERLLHNQPGLLVLSRVPSFSPSCPYLVVAEGEWNTTLTSLCDHYYPKPSHLKLLAVTGTNGKTTTADLALQMGEMAGLKGFSIGTLGVRQRGQTIEEFGLTTPGQLQLRAFLARYGTDADFAVMEASSHALEQGRVHGLMFEAAAWTSFTQDHLDYHKNMEDYFQAKALILQALAPGAKLFVPMNQRSIIEKLNDPRVVALADPSREEQGKLPLFFQTAFNRENFVCAQALVRALGVQDFQLDLARLLPPPGRFYIREWQGRTAVVDFAHTPDALENILAAIKQTFPGKKIITLFGCGGDRDRTKRPLMAAASAKYSQHLIITSDNPRTEDPRQILDDIVQGVGSCSHELEVDRPTAVRKALSELQSGDVLLMAGKGHEDYIIKGTEKVHYSDIEELDRFVDSRKG